jgi:hypothetical protein
VTRETWSPQEKKAARAAFAAAWTRECTAIKREVEAMLAGSAAPDAIWQVQEYLWRKRRELGDKYDYRYSILLNVFARLLAQGWLTAADIASLAPEKVEHITSAASVWKDASAIETPSMEQPDAGRAGE